MGKKTWSQKLSGALLDTRVEMYLERIREILPKVNPTTEYRWHILRYSCLYLLTNVRWTHERILFSDRCSVFMEIYDHFKCSHDPNDRFHLLYIVIESNFDFTIFCDIVEKLPAPWDHYLCDQVFSKLKIRFPFSQEMLGMIFDLLSENKKIKFFFDTVTDDDVYLATFLLGIQPELATTKSTRGEHMPYIWEIFSGLPLESRSETPIYNAKSVQMINLLTFYGANVNTQIGKHDLLTHYCITKRSIEVISHMVKNFNVNASDSIKYIPLSADEEYDAKLLEILESQ